MPKQNLRISGVINTYNEEKNIEACLKSIIWLDEIVIVDMYSNDNTVKIASKYTKKIYRYPYKGYVEIARNYALKKANYDWILILDADERLPTGVERIIRTLVTTPSIDGYWFPRRNYINKNRFLKYGYFYPDYQLRLYKNVNNIRYTGFIHEQPRVNLNHTQNIMNIEIYHNSSHSKYASFSSFKNFLPYIKFEVENFNRLNQSSFYLLLFIVIDPIRHFYRSFIKLEGYRDGYYGFRAALLYALYKELVLINYMIKRFK